MLVYRRVTKPPRFFLPRGNSGDNFGDILEVEPFPRRFEALLLGPESLKRPASFWTSDGQMPVPWVRLVVFFFWNGTEPKDVQYIYICYLEPK